MKISHTFTFVSITLIVFLKPLTSVTLLPYGLSHINDVDLQAGDDTTKQVTLLQPLTFFGNTYNSIWIASNGFIGFGDHTDCCYPILKHTNPMIAPLWDDWEPGILYYRQTTTDVTDLEAATTYVRSIYPEFNTYQASWALVSTWSYFILWSTGDKFANFQTVLTSDGTNSFAIFLYERIDAVNAASAVVDAGDGTNYYLLCGSVNQAMVDLPLMKQTCTSEPGVFMFRLDSNNPEQANYECTQTLISAGEPEASYICRWTDAAQSSMEMTFILSKPNTCGITAWDTQKFEDGDDPTLTDPTCETEYTKDPSKLTFTIDSTATPLACGVRSPAANTFDITIRAFYDSTFETAQDVLYKFTCDETTALPASIEQSAEFSAIELSPLPTIIRTLQLLVVSPDTGGVLSMVRIGQLFQLRIVYDNTANNIDPYGVYVDYCNVADTSGFDVKTFQFITDGCVVENDSQKPWYMTRSFQQTSLSPTGLFISDSGYMYGARFTTQDEIFFQCRIQFCFFASTSTNKCTDSCTGGVRRKRSTNETDADTVTLYTSVIIEAMEDNNEKLADSTLPQESKDCVDRLSVLLTTGIMGLFTVLNTVVAFILFRKGVDKVR